MREDLEKITFFAATNSRGKETPFGIKRRDRARHVYVIGKTGMGKSTLLENMAIQDIRNGEGIAFIDPHGSTADRILEYVPAHRTKDVVYFAPFDMEYPIAFNVMEDVGYDKRHLVVSGLLSAFRKIWVDAWSARMEYILSNTLLALLEYEGATLLDVNRMLVNKKFRQKVVDNVTDPIVKSFWAEEFANYTDRYTQDATPAIQNKVGQFTSNPLIRNIVGQPKSSFDIRTMMDEKKILIINLSKGRVGEVNATLLGSMLVTKIYLAAMSRADVSPQTLLDLPSFYFYVDEFQTFANESFADILSEARKYKLNLIIAHQYIEQMEEEVRDAVFGNVGTTIAFRVGPFDAEVLETIFQPQFTETDLVNLGFAQIYLTLMIDGVGSPPFSATTLPPFDPPPERFVDEALANSRTMFAKHRADVESAISQWHEIDVTPKKVSASSSGSTSVVGAHAPKREEKPAASPLVTVPVPIVASEKKPEPAVIPVAVVESVRAQSSPVTMSVRKEPVHVPAPLRHAEAKVIGIEVAREHAMVSGGTSAGQNAPPSRIHKQKSHPHVPKAAEMQKDMPPLGGAKSLREALAMVTGKKIETQEAAPQVEAQKVEPQKNEHGAHALDLKETLGKIVVKSSPVQNIPPSKPAQLPENVLREMLAVDEPRDEKT